MSNQTPAWIRQIADLNDVERTQMEDQFPLLQINDDLAFDLIVWRDAEPWKQNAIQPREGTQLRLLRDEILSRGMDNKPVLDPTDGWIADGNSRLLAYDEIRRDGQHVAFPGFDLRSFDNDVERHDYQVACAVVHRQLATKERKCLIRVGISHHPEWTDNRLGVLYGLTQDTVTRISDEMVANADIPPRPDKRIDAAGREIDVTKLKKKAKKDGAAKPSHPLLPLVTAWHAARGGHGTTSAELLPIAESAGIDLVALGACKAEHQGSGRLKAVTAWIGNHSCVPIGNYVITAYRHSSSGFTVFSLVRRGDYRPDLVEKPDVPSDEPNVDDDTTSENRNP